MKRIEMKLSNFFSTNIKSYMVAMGCALVLFQTSCDNDDDNNGSNGTGTTSVSTQSTFNGNDRMFIDSATVSGMAEVQLGQLAANKASDNTVRSFGQQMVAEHTDANNQLMSIARNKNVTPPAQLDPAHQALATRLASYSGHQFDTAYMNSQVIDHRKAIILFQNEANNNGGDQTVRGYASSNLPNLNRHLQRADSIVNSINGVNTGGTTSGTTSGTTGTTGSTTNGTTTGTTGSTSNGTTSGSGTTSSGSTGNIQY
jgi:putative membrane protein